jgi:hypothetical protein
MNGSATAVIAVIIKILISFPFTLLLRIPKIFGPVDKSGFCFENPSIPKIPSFLGETLTALGLAIASHPLQPD